MFIHQRLRLIWLLALFLLAMLFVGGAQPAAAGMFVAPWDKLAHIGYFMALMLVLIPLFPRRLWLGVCIALLVGAADEIQQMLLPGRDAGIDDWLADALGVALAVCLHRAVGSTMASSPTGGARG